ncbi:hypothetical protein E2542_SST08256 [Spatholobus suberectus]|nr:hypothetical protein E2542_SST08256 [Spatholobus suberectus]
MGTQIGGDVPATRWRSARMTVCFCRLKVWWLPARWQSWKCDSDEGGASVGLAVVSGASTIADGLTAWQSKQGTHDGSSAQTGYQQKRYTKLCASETHQWRHHHGFCYSQTMLVNGGKIRIQMVTEAQ